MSSYHAQAAIRKKIAAWKKSKAASVKSAAGERPVHDLATKSTTIRKDASSYVPIDEWQVCQFRHPTQKCLGLILIVQTVWKATVERLWKQHDIGYTVDKELAETSSTVRFFCNMDAYDDAQRAFADEPALASQIRPLAPELRRVVERQNDSQLFAVVDDTTREQLWSRIPSHLVAALSPFQKEGVEFLFRNRGRGMIADEMGLGKTIQSIAFMLSSEDTDRDFPLAVFCPKAVHGNWRNEWIKWSRCKDPTEIVLVKSTKMCLELLGASTVSTRPTSATVRRSRAAPSSLPPTPRRRHQLDAFDEPCTTDYTELMDQQIQENAISVAHQQRRTSPVTPIRNGKRTRLDEAIDTEADHGVHEGKKRQKRASSTKVYVFTYELMIQPAVFKAVSEFRFPSFIFDESHKLMTLDSQRTQACLRLSYTARRVVLLSGTPGFRPAELYPQLFIVHPWMFPKFYQHYPKWIKKIEQAREYDRTQPFTFAARYCNPHPVFIPGAEIRWELRKRSCRLQELRDIIQHYLFIHRLKSQVLTHLRPIRRRRILFHLSGHDRAQCQEDLNMLNQYKDTNPRKYETHFMDIYNNRLPSIKMPIVERYVVHWLTEGYGSWMRHALAYLIDARVMPTLPLSQMILSYLSHPKLLLFAHHIRVLHSLDELLTQWGVEHVLISGQTAAEERDHLIQCFQTSPNVQVAVLGLTALNAGVNLDAAQTVMFCELYWTPSVMLQAEGRAHRYNSTGDVYAYYLMILGTMDEIMWQNLEAKQTTANTLMERPKSSCDTLPGVPAARALPSQAILELI